MKEQTPQEKAMAQRKFVSKFKGKPSKKSKQELAMAARATGV